MTGPPRFSSSKAIALNSIFPVVTMLGSYLVLGKLPSAWQVTAIPPAIIGVLLMTQTFPKRAIAADPAR